MSFKVDYISDWKGRLRSRIYEQYSGLPNTVAFSDMLAKQFQDLEDSGQTLFTITSIDDSEGVNLDVIGRIVKQLRLGFDDPTYRLLLKARIRANKSSGTPEDMYSVYVALYGGTVTMIYVGGNDASFVMRMLTPITSIQAQIGVSFLTDIKMAGVLGNFEWQEFPDSEMFTTAEATVLTVARSATDTTLTVLDTTQLEPSGTLIIDENFVNQDTVSYTVTGPTTISCSPLGNAHSVNAIVSVVGSPGLGFATATSVNSPASIGDLVLNVVDDTDFPSSGSLIIDQGMPNEEIATFTVPFSNQFAVSALTQNHSNGAIVTLNDPAVGGVFEGALAS